MPVQWTNELDRRLLLCVLTADPAVKLDHKHLALLCGSTHEGIKKRLNKLRKESQQILKEFLTTPPFTYSQSVTDGHFLCAQLRSGGYCSPGN